jgi:hypothetical protein
MKQRILEDNLWHIGKVKAETMLRPIYGPTPGDIGTVPDYRFVMSSKK